MPHVNGWVELIAGVFDLDVQKTLESGALCNTIAWADGEDPPPGQKQGALEGLPV